MKRDRVKIHSNLTLEILNQPFLLEKRIDLLFAIQKEGSISKAAKVVPMSYKSAWEAVDSMNNLSPTPIVQKETGGKGGGGTKLTTYGENLLKTYQVLKKEQEKFLENLTNMTDMDTGTLKTIKRFAMQISARNQIQGIVKEVILGDVNANVILIPKSGHEIFSNISKNSVINMDIKEGAQMVAIFKSSNVLLTTSNDITISGRNKIKGIIKDIHEDAVNSEVTIDIGDNETITSVITVEAIKELKLEIGTEVTAIIKSSDIMIGK